MKHNADNYRSRGGAGYWSLEGQTPTRGRRGPHPDRADFGPGSGHGGRGPRGGGRRGGRGRPRGNIRAAILMMLEKEPRHGYDLIRAIEERTGGAWAPSPGSVYPTLQALEDEGLVSISEVDGRKTASVTDAGREWLATNAPSEDEIFTAVRGGEDARALKEELHALTEAAVHVARRSGKDDAAAKVTAILASARKDIYRLLVDDES